jgi:hypothetical protein
MRPLWRVQPQRVSPRGNLDVDVLRQRQREACAELLKWKHRGGEETLAPFQVGERSLAE